jgi:hypothetical protein
MTGHPMTWEEYLEINFVVPVTLCCIVGFVAFMALVVKLARACLGNFWPESDNEDEKPMADSAGKTLGL